MRKYELRKTVKAKQRIKRHAPTLFNGIIQFVEYFDSEAMCLAYLENIRWKDGKYCPHCGFFEVWQLEDKINYKCKTCTKTFNVKTGTIFEAGKISLRNWFMAIYLENSFNGGCTTGELERQLPISRKTVGLMVNKIRKHGHNQNSFTTCEVNGEQIYILDTMVRDGENRNRHDWRKHSYDGGSDRRFILVIIQKNGYVKAYPIDGVAGEEVLPHIYNHIPDGATVYTDEHTSFNPLGKAFKKNVENDPKHEQYNPLKKQYKHKTVNHSKKLYGVDGVSTNAVEGWNSFFQTGLGKFRNSISLIYTPLFINAAVFRYNTRYMNETEKLDMALTNIFTYLVDKDEPKLNFKRQSYLEKDKLRVKNYQANKLKKELEKAEKEKKQKEKKERAAKKAAVEQRKKDREQRQADAAQKRLDKKAVREKKIADKEKERQDKKAAREQSKAAREQAKQQAREQKKQFKQAVKQAVTAKQAGRINKTSKAGNPKKINKIFKAGKAGRTNKTIKTRLNNPKRTTRTKQPTRKK